MDAKDHVAALRALAKKDHEELIAEIAERARDAAAHGDAWSERFYRERIARLEAIPKPWESPLPDNLAS